LSYSAGACLKNRRLECGLTYREVERLTRDLAAKYRDTGYIVRISVLADIENQGTVPSLFRLKSLCMIYSLELEAVLSWYGLPSGPEPAATLDQEPVASRRLERPVSPAPVSLIFFITCCFLAIGIGVLVVRQFTGSDAWVVEYFQMPVAQIMICFAAVQVWYGNTMARKVAWGALHQIAWTVITCSAVCQLIGLLLSQILGVSSRLNPLVLQSGPLSALIPELWRLGLTIGGPLRFALLSIGFGLILKAHPERRLRRFKPLDWTVFSLLALYIASCWARRFFFTAWRRKAKMKWCGARSAWVFFSRSSATLGSGLSIMGICRPRCSPSLGRCGCLLPRRLHARRGIGCLSTRRQARYRRSAQTPGSAREINAASNLVK